MATNLDVIWSSQKFPVFSLLATVILTYFLFQIIYNIYFHPLANIPGPRTWSISRLPFIGALLRGTIVHDFERLHSIYGPVIRVAPNEVTFADEAAWADIFQTRADTEQFLKDPLWWGRQRGQPNSLLSAIDPEEHASIRMILAPAFTARALRAQEPIIHQYVNLLVERLHELVTAAQDKRERAADIDMTPWFHFTTFDVFGDLGFGESFNCLQSSKYHPWIALLFNSVKAASFIAAVKYYPLLQSILLKCIPKSLKQTQTDHFWQPLPGWTSPWKIALQHHGTG
ncbi:benzoate 4-monooxygenase cytochrome P450 [Diaporthe helianthi]|uniref:Benzoate 4-monooxygenase cytochrome P450 n=1 Tax=Diaporthe helianthi TaxID=158607 RepID=A0A2P5HZX4_DIAHE|nr:benzoate 4-monooxygenase cytochrome P450 [Diaporthe helianthi]